jgi:CHASE2 domain-containing sensor protein
VLKSLPIDFLNVHSYARAAGTQLRIQYCIQSDAQKDEINFDSFFNHTLPKHELRKDFMLVGLNDRSNKSGWAVSYN